MTSLRWGVGTLMWLIGAMMLVTPHQFGSPVYAALAPMLPVLGAVFLGLGICLSALNTLQGSRPATIAIHVLAGVTLLVLASGFARTGGWTGTSNWLVLGVGTALAPFYTRPDDHEKKVDLFVVLVGLGAALTGATILALPGLFGSSIYDVIRPLLPAFGWLFLVSGLFLTAVQLRPRTRRSVRLLAHLLAGGVLLAFFLASAIPLRAWIGIAYYGGFGTALLLMPWLESRLRTLHPRSLQARTALGLAIVATVPLVAAVTLIHAVVFDSTLRGEHGAYATRDWSFLILLFWTVAAVIAGILVARWLAQPLEAVTVAAGKLAAGDAAAPLPKSSVPELQGLAIAFGEMRGELTARVVERERLLGELQETNEELRARGEEIGAQAEDIQSQNEELRQANDELARAMATAEAAVRARDEFLSVAAHELKTPITSLRGFAQILLAQLDRTGKVQPERLALVVPRIERQSQRLADLINQLLDVSRIEAGKLVLQKQTLSLAELAEEVVGTLRPVYPERQFVLEARERATVALDALRMEQALTNLLTNAVKFSPNGAPVEVAVDADGDQAVRLSVRDYGPGIAPEERSRIFERFYQIDDGEWRGGMGLGLFVSHQIVELHGGSLTVECPPDGGTRFVVKLGRG